MPSHDLPTFQREDGSTRHNRHHGQRSSTELVAITGDEQAEDNNTVSDLLKKELGAYLPHSAEAAQLARQRIRASFTNVLASPILNDVLLIATELVTNSFRHARPPILLSVSIIQDNAQTVLIEVTDAGPSPDGRTPPVLPNEENGRGNHIVAALSDNYGIRQLKSSAITRWAEICSALQNSTSSQQTSMPSRLP